MPKPMPCNRLPTLVFRPVKLHSLSIGHFVTHVENTVPFEAWLDNLGLNELQLLPHRAQRCWSRN